MPALQGAGLGPWSDHWRALNQWGQDAERRMQETSVSVQEIWDA